MEEIDLLHLLKYFKKKIIILLVIFVLVFGCSYLYLLKKTETTYSFNSTVLIFNKDILSEGNYDLENIVNTTVQIIKSDLVIEKVIENIELDKKIEEVKNNLEVKRLENSDIIKISFNNNSKENTENIVNEFIDVSSDELNNIYENVDIKVVDESKEVEATINFSTSKKIFLSGFIGIICSFGIIFIMYIIKKEKRDM